MAGNNRNWLDSIKNLPGWITGFIAFVTAVVGFFKLWQGETGLVTMVLLAVGVGGGTLGCAYLAYHLYQRARPPTKVILLVADFDGPEPQKYRVTETVLARLRAALEPYDDVQVEALGRAITEAEGSDAARAKGEKRKAAIVVWGWYGTTAKTVPLSVHFEVLRPPEHMPELGLEAKGLVQTMAVAELESFTLQTQLSAEMAYLSLSTVGMVRYAAEDWDGAIARFSDAFSQTAERVPALDQSTVYFYSGNAYRVKDDTDRAIADYDRAIQLQPDYANAYNNRGAAYVAKGDYDRAIQFKPDLAEAYMGLGLAYDHKGDYDRAIADYNQAIQLQPDLAEAYMGLGLAYDHKGNYGRAIADFDQAIRLQPDDAKAYNNRGAAYCNKGDHDRAIADFDQAIQLQPDDASAYFNRGFAYAQEGEKEKAIADFKTFLALSNDPYWRQQVEEQLKALGAK